MKTNNYPKQSSWTLKLFWHYNLNLIKWMSVLCLIITNTNGYGQCSYPTTLVVQSQVILPGQYIAYKATDTIVFHDFRVVGGANVIAQAPVIILLNDSVDLSSDIQLITENPCLTSSKVYPDSVLASRLSVCPGCFDGADSTTLRVVSNAGGSPNWKWYKNEYGDDSPPDLTVLIGSGNSIEVAPLHKTDYFVRNESTTPFGEFAQIKITTPVLAFFYDTNLVVRS